MTASARGMLWMFGAALFFSASVGFVKYLSGSMTPFQIVFVRQIMGVAFMLPWLLRVGLTAIHTDRLSLHCWRAFFSYGGMAGSYYAFTMIYIADAVALQFTTPLFTTILAILFLKENVRIHRWLALFFGFVGVLIIVRPGFVEIGLGIPIALLAAVFYAGSNVTNRALSRTDSTASILFYSFILQIPLATIPAMATWVTPDLVDLPFLLGFGVIAIAAQWCLTRALAVAEASLVEPVMFVRLPCVTVIGYFLFAQIPDNWTWIGAIVIFSSTYLLARLEAKQLKT